MAKLKLAPREVTARREGDALYLESPMPLATPPERLGTVFRRAAERAPERVFLMERRDDELIGVSYADALLAAEGIADWLVREQPRDARVLALSGNSLDHALLMLGCFLAGVPFVPVSPAYSLLSQDFAKLKTVIEKVRPTAVFAETRSWPSREVALATAAAAMSVTGGAAPTFVVGSRELHDAGCLPLADLFSRKAGDAFREREASVTADHVAKILFTSGSTGSPKGVPNTHRMLCSNQQMIAQLWPFLGEVESPVLVDWLPWSHTFGGNHNFNMILFHAGTLLIDEGKPTQAGMVASLRNLREIYPTLYFNVPAGYAALVPHLERDEELRKTFFSKLRVMFYAAAALPPDLWDRLTKLAASVVDPEEREVFMTTAWGSTETSPLSTSAHFVQNRSGNIGLPAPGVTLKIVPNGNKREVRVKGPHVMTGYLDEPELTKEAFDEEGFYRIGDAVKLANPDDPSEGLLFDGRVAEDFKLSTGTWVSVTTIRTGVVALAGGVISDVVVCGHDREEVCLLAWPSLPVGRALVGADGEEHGEEELSPAALCAAEVVRERVLAAVTAWNAQNPASSTRVARVLLLAEPPSIDAGEVTDKGYTNQRATLERRAAEVARLYTAPHDASAIVLGPVWPWEAKA